MKKKVIGSMLTAGLVVSTLVGCSDVSSPQDTIQQQTDQKLQQAGNMFSNTSTPPFNRSVERENIKNRLILENSPTTLEWIYTISNGRVMGRFAVRGKVTSGNKRMTTTQQITEHGTNGAPAVTETPDEMGTYGASDPYVFWFDPAGNYYQWEGTYLVTTLPYAIDPNQTINFNVVDSNEKSNISHYKDEIQQYTKGRK